MLEITKVDNSIRVKGNNNKFFPNNGELDFPLNSIIVVVDESDMISFKSSSNYDNLFSGLINEITINGNAVTKDNIIDAFSAISNSVTGGGGTGDVDLSDYYTKTQTDNKFATKEALTNVANKVDTIEQYDDTEVKKEITDIKTNVTEIQNTLGDVVSNDAFGELENVVSMKANKSEVDALTEKVDSIEIPDTSDLVTKEELEENKPKEYEFNSNALTKALNTSSKGLFNVYNETDANKPLLKDILENIKNSDIIVNSGYNVLIFLYKIEGSINKYIFLPVKYNLTGSSLPLSYITLRDYGTGTMDWIVGDSDIQPKLTAGNNITIDENNKISVNIPDTNIFEFVDELPTENISENKVYIVPSDNISEKNLYTEYYYKDGEWEKFGEFTTEVDLSNYYNKGEIDNKLSELNTTVSDIDNKVDTNTSKLEDLETSLDDKQDLLVSGANIKTVNGQSIIGEGNLEIQVKDVDLSDYATKDELTAVENKIPENIPSQSEIDDISADISALEADMMGKQATLESGVNIKTINGESILGEGDITISGGGDVDLSQYAKKSEVPTVQEGVVGDENNYIYSSDDGIHDVLSSVGYGISEDGEVRFRYYKWGNNQEYSYFTFPNATSENSGLLSLADKQKLDSLENVDTSNFASKWKIVNITASAIASAFSQVATALIKGDISKTVSNIQINDAAIEAFKTVNSGDAVNISGASFIAFMAQPYTEGVTSLSYIMQTQPVPLPTFIYITVNLTNNTATVMANGNSVQVIFNVDENSFVMDKSGSKPTLKSKNAYEWYGTQAEYDAVETKDDNTLYYIIEE